MLPELKECHFRVACDVTNPLCGENGATYIYGPQKGVTEEMREGLDEAMGSYAEVTKKSMGTDCALMEGAGAAGGLGFAFLSFLGAELLPGIELVLDAVGMEKAMEGADLVIHRRGHDWISRPQWVRARWESHGSPKKRGAKDSRAGRCGRGRMAVRPATNAGIDAYFPILRRGRDAGRGHGAWNGNSRI